VGLAIAGGILINNLLHRPSPNADAWTGLMVPSSVKVPADDARYEGMPAEVRPLLKVADDHPNTTAARWALLRAANALYSRGVNDLPNQRVTARPVLGQALEMYDRVLAASPEATPEYGDALLGKARTQEARGDLDDAIATYKLAATKLGDTAAGKSAAARAAELDTPLARQFYRDFYEQDFSTASTVPGGASPGALPGFGNPVPGGDPLGGLPGIDDILKVPPMPAETGAPTGELPKDIFTPPAPAEGGTTPEAPAGTPETKPAEPATETPAPTTPPATTPEGPAETTPRA
jgi:hypothetical protein